MTKYKNFPLDECAGAMRRILRDNPGAAVFQKWTCAGCGQRVTGNTPNGLFEQGHHEECGAVTDIRKTGCNYSVHYAIGGLASAPPKGSA